MSAAIKKMLADRARVAEDRKIASRLDRKWDRIVSEMMTMIDKSAPFIDEDSDPTKWKPSTLLKLAYFIASTAPYPGGEKRAVLYASCPSRQGGISYADGRKQPGISGTRDNGIGYRWFQDGAAKHGSKSTARKQASASIAKIPLALSSHIARVYRPAAAVSETA